METSELISLLTVPLFTGAIGYLTNWSGVWMLFYPVEFRGIRVPGLATISCMSMGSSNPCSRIASS